MSSTLETMLVGVAGLSMAVLVLLIIYLMTAIFRTDTQKVEIVGTQKVKHEGEITARDNVYTEMAAGKQSDAAAKNLRAAELSLERARVEEQTEQMRHKNAVAEIELRNSGSA